MNESHPSPLNRDLAYKPSQFNGTRKQHSQGEDWAPCPPVKAASKVLDLHLIGLVEEHMQRQCARPPGRSRELPDIDRQSSRKAGSKMLDLQALGMVQEQIQRQRLRTAARSIDLDDQRQIFRKAGSKVLDSQVIGLVQEQIQQQRVWSASRSIDLDEERNRKFIPRSSIHKEPFPFQEEAAFSGNAKAASKVLDLQLVGLVYEEMQRQRVRSAVNSIDQDEERFIASASPKGREIALPEYYADRPTASSQALGGKIVNWFKNSPDESPDEEVPVWILHPESYGKVGWDIFTGAQVIIVCFLLPFEICFMDTQNIPIPYWWSVMEICMTACFMLDIFVNFFSAYRERVHSPVVSDLQLIAKKYSQTWLVTDVVAAFPFFLFDPSSPGQHQNKLNLSKLGRFTRFLRLVRLARLLRLLKLPRLFLLVQNLERKVNLHPGLSRMGRIIASVVFGVHFAACLWFAIGRSIHYCGLPNPWPVETMDELSCSWISYFGYVHGFQLNQTFTLERQYLASFYFSLTTLATVGYGDISGRTYAEQIFAMTLMIFGVVWYSFVLSSTTSIINSFQGNEDKLHQRLREANLFINEAKLPNELGKKMRRHFRAVNTNKNALNNSREYDTQEIISKLSNDLKAEVILWIQRHVIASIPFLKECYDRVFVAALVVDLVPLMFSANEHIFRENDVFEKILFIVKGSAISTIGGTYFRVFQQGEELGLSGILTEGVQKISVYALINCHMECLPVQAFLHLSRFYEEHVHKLWKAAETEFHAVEAFKHIPADEQKGLRQMLKKQQAKLDLALESETLHEAPVRSSTFSGKSMSKLLDSGRSFVSLKRWTRSLKSSDSASSIPSVTARPVRRRSSDTARPVRRRSSDTFMKNQPENMLYRAQSQAGVLAALDGGTIPDISRHVRRNSFQGATNAQYVSGLMSKASWGCRTSKPGLRHNLKHSSSLHQHTSSKNRISEAKKENYEISDHLSELMQIMIDQKIQSLVNVATKNVQAVCSK